MLVQSFLFHLHYDPRTPINSAAVAQMLRHRFQDRVKVHEVTGRPGAGKTKYIMQQMPQGPSDNAVILSFATSTDHLTILKQLSCLRTEAHAVVFINVSAYADFGFLSRVLLELACMGTVVEPLYGISFAVPAEARITIYVEVRRPDHISRLRVASLTNKGTVANICKSYPGFTLTHRCPPLLCTTASPSSSTSPLSALRT